MSSFFLRGGSDEVAPGVVETFEGTASTSGPWSDRHMHAGPAAALIGRQVERAAGSAAFGLPPEGFASRVSIDIHRPIPVGPVNVVAVPVRSGRQVGLVRVDLFSEDRSRPEATAHVWILRGTEALDVPTTPAPPAEDAGEVRWDFPAGWDCGYLRSIEWTWVAGEFGRPGPVEVGTRSRIPLVDGESLTGLQRILLVADSGSGISAVADPATLLFVNTDLTVHLHRVPDGERVWMRSTSFLEPAGVGLATTTLRDERGQLGVGNQSLFVARR